MTGVPFDSGRAAMRVRDVLRAIAEVRSLLDGKVFDDLCRESVTQAALERFLEIISEASRGVPEQWKVSFGPSIPWRRVADIGNRIRHEYYRVDPLILWELYERDLDPLEAAMIRMLDSHDQVP